MATKSKLEMEREQIQAEIKRRGGPAKAPNFVKQLADLDARIAAEKTTSAAVAAPKQTARQETRLQYLKRVDPKSPEIKELEKKLAAGGGGANPTPGDPGTAPGGRGTGTVGSDKESPYNMKSVDDFLNSALNGLGDLDLSGAPKILTAGDLAAQRQTTQDSLYAEDTKYLDRNRARSMEETKQELAQRGIQYDPAAAEDPNTQDLYGRTVGAINEGYKKDQQSALDRARSGADQRMATEAGVNKAASDSFVTNAVQGWQSKLDKLNTGNSLLDTLMRDYHMTQQEAEAALQRKSNERLTKMGIRAKGGGGSGGGNGGGGGNTGVGFEIIS